MSEAIKQKKKYSAKYKHLNVKIIDSKQDKEMAKELDLETTSLLHKQLAEFHKILKTLKKDSSEHTFMVNKIKTIREELKGHSQTVYKIIISQGKKNFWAVYINPPTAKDIKDCADKFFEALKGKRDSLKHINIEHKDFLGFKYKTIGGTFVKDKEVLEVSKNSNPSQRIEVAKKPHEKIRDNFVGIELELIAKADRTTLKRKFIEAKLAGYIHIKDDGSIRVEQPGEYPHEITILCRQAMVKEVVTKVCSVLKDSEVEAYVNSSCGMHVHIDARNRNHKILYNNLVRALPMLSAMVPYERVYSNAGLRYCRMNITNDYDKSFSSLEGREARYQAINPDAYNKYRTIEVRLHSGTVNAAKIINWVAILCKFADETTMLTQDIKTYLDFYNRWPELPTKLIEYIKRRTEVFTEKGKGADTKGDHTWETNYEIAI